MARHERCVTSVRLATVLPIVALVVIGSTLGIVVMAPDFVAPSEDSYDRTTVTVGEDDHDVEVRVADTFHKRYVGLSATDSLEFGEGMLFVHGSESDRTYVMRRMDFALDIVFIDAKGTITAIHHAPEPTDGDGRNQRYSGTGKYVLEVPMGYTNETGVEPGDRVEIDDY